MSKLKIWLFILQSCWLVFGRRRLPDNTYNKTPSDPLISPYDNNTHTFNYSNRFLRSQTKDDHFVSNIPLFSGNFPRSYAGHLYVESDHSALFYWLFESLNDAKQDPLIIWMNGGPGCSSMDGLFLELGPLKLKDGNVVLNKYGWHNTANLLFIDQPVGTGLSYTKKSKYPKNDDEVNRHFYKMLMEFFQLHNEYVSVSNGQLQSRKIYMTGESHAGHYIPSMVKYIMEKNKKVGSNDVVVNIEGIAIGNGWIDPFNQYDVSDFMHGMGVISLGQKYTLKEREKNCQALLRRGQFKSSICFSLLDDVLANTGTPTTGRMTMYDVRETSRSSTYPPGHEEVERYLNRKDVRQALHATATPHAYKECADPPYYALAHQDGKPAVEELTYVLNSNKRVLLFSGQFDIICNHLGTEKMLNKLRWNGRDQWLKASTRAWVVDNSPAGYVRTAANLQNLVVMNAGHMVPLSRPAESLDMIQRFIANKPLAIPSQSTIASTLPARVADASKRQLRALNDTSISRSTRNDAAPHDHLGPQETGCRCNLTARATPTDRKEDTYSAVIRASIGPLNIPVQCESVNCTIDAEYYRAVIVFIRSEVNYIVTALDMAPVVECIDTVLDNSKDSRIDGRRYISISVSVSGKLRVINSFVSSMKVVEDRGGVLFTKLDTQSVMLYMC